MNAGTHLQKERAGVCSTFEQCWTQETSTKGFIHRKHASTLTQREISSETVNIKLSSRPIRIKDFRLPCPGFLPKSTPKNLYYICLTANTLPRPIHSLLFFSWVYVCVSHCTVSLISAMTDDVTFGDLKRCGRSVLRRKQ